MDRFRRLVMSGIWFLVVIPCALVAAFFAGISHRIDDTFQDLDPDWNPLHPLRVPPPPPGDDEMAPMRVDD